MVVGAEAEMDGTSASGQDPIGVARTAELLQRFLANRGASTLRAYRNDVEEFASFLGQRPPVAIAGFLAGGPSAARTVALEYAVDLRQHHRAPATVIRRLATVRALVGAAREAGLIEWWLDVPSEHEVAAAAAASRERTPSEDVRYLLPRHPGEIDRLDVQHYALRETLGANYVAPVEEPRRVLDVGCGTGQWGFELSIQFPDALVVGLDMVAGKPEQPPRYRWVKGNLLLGLPFAHEQFDFVHQRLLVTGIPVASWPSLVADIVRVTRPGGWVELVEPPLRLEEAGPATQRLLDLTTGISASLGLDTTSVVFDALDEYLRQAGLTRVVRQELSVPIGRWGGAIGSLLTTDLRAGFTRVCEVLQARSSLTAEEGRDILLRAQEEWEHGRMSWTFAIAFGQKPG
jgi:SAM-dependent methyltransferase